MTNLILELPDDLARGLEGIAHARHVSLQQLAVERLSSLVKVDPDDRVGSAAALLRAMREPPHLSVADVDELDATIAACRLPVMMRDLFPE